MQKGKEKEGKTREWHGSVRFAGDTKEGAAVSRLLSSSTCCAMQNKKATETTERGVGEGEERVT